MKITSKAIIFLLLAVIVLTSCNNFQPVLKTKPTEVMETALAMVRAAIAETQSAIPTATLPPSATPLPTATLLPPTKNSSCGNEIEQNKTLSSSENEAPLSEFIIGKWKYEGKYYVEDQGYADIFWQYTFVDEKAAEIQAGPECRSCIYKFIEPEVITIDNCSPQLAGIMKWSIKRDGQFLLIQRLDSGQFKGGEQLPFERVVDR